MPTPRLPGTTTTVLRTGAYSCPPFQGMLPNRLDPPDQLARQHLSRLVVPGWPILGIRLRDLLGAGRRGADCGAGGGVDAPGSTEHSVALASVRGSRQ